MSSALRGGMGFLLVRGQHEMKNELTDKEINDICKMLARANIQDLVNILENISYLKNEEMLGLLWERVETCKDWETVKFKRGLR